MYASFFKRLIDLLFAGIILFVFSPLLLITILLLAFVNQGKPFFFQERPGIKGQIFKIVKFKTMNDRRNQHGELLSDKDRLTAIGKLVRDLSLDEIPQMLNVIKGEMSLVGPRPLLVEYLSHYNERQSRRHEVRPGITGWAQVNGRNTLDWQTKFEYDVWYVEHLSFLLDMKILFLTVKKVFIREGISGENTVTMEKFKGNKE